MCRVQETADTRNALESYIYDLKAKLSDTLRAYTTEEAANAFKYVYMLLTSVSARPAADLERMPPL